MSYILRIDSSSRAHGSHSSRLADMIEKELVSASGLPVRRRNLIDNPEQHINDMTIAGFYTASEDVTPELRDATANSDHLIDELKSAHALIIAAPMYNFSAPSALKAWIDQIVRINYTFAFDGSNFAGLVPANHAFLALAYGAHGYGKDGDLAAMNFLEPYLTSLCAFLGFENVDTFAIEATTGEQDQVEQQYAALAAQIGSTIGKGA